MELQKKRSRLAAIALALAVGASVLTAADPNAEVVSLLTDLDDDINRWHGLPGGSVQPERDELKEGMGRRLDRFSTVFDSGLGPLATATPVAGPNRLLIRRSIGTLDRAAAIDPDDHELGSSIAAAYIAVAQVQGHPSHRNLGQTRESAATYAKATRILARVRRQAPEYARGRSLASRARTSVYAYSRYPWFEPEVFVLLDLGGGREPGTPLRGESGAANNYGDAIGSGVAGDLGNLVQEVVRTKGEQILAGFGDSPGAASDVDLREVESRHARVEQKAQRVWDAADELHGNLVDQGGLRADVIGYLARLQIFLQEATAALEDSDGGRAQRNLVRAEYEIGRLGKAIGVTP
jgi:hypothetical protein